MRFERLLLSQLTVEPSSAEDGNLAVLSTNTTITTPASMEPSSAEDGNRADSLRASEYVLAASMEPSSAEDGNIAFGGSVANDISRFNGAVLS